MLKIRGARGAVVEDLSLPVGGFSLVKTQPKMTLLWSLQCTGNHFLSPECEIMKKIRQDRTWIEAGIPWTNFTPSKYNALGSNDVTIPVNSLSSQMNTIATQSTVLPSRLKRTEIVLKSTDRMSNINSSCSRAKPWVFYGAYIKGNHMILFQ